MSKVDRGVQFIVCTSSMSINTYFRYTAIEELWQKTVYDI